MEDDLKKRIVTCALRMFVMDDTADSYERRLRYEEDPMARASLSVEYARARAEALAVAVDGDQQIASRDEPESVQFPVHANARLR